MLAYTVVFAFLSIRWVHSDVELQYPIIITAWAAFYYIVIFVGNLLYSLNRVPSVFRRPWKIVFPLLIAQFVFAAVYDMQHDETLSSDPVALLVAAWIIGLLLIFPSFRAHYLIGFGREADRRI
jgi:hypothetical protein